MGSRISAYFLISMDYNASDSDDPMEAMRKGQHYLKTKFSQQRQFQQWSLLYPKPMQQYSQWFCHSTPSRQELLVMLPHVVNSLTLGFTLFLHWVFSG